MRTEIVVEPFRLSGTHPDPTLHRARERRDGYHSNVPAPERPAVSKRGVPWRKRAFLDRRICPCCYTCVRLERKRELLAQFLPLGSSEAVFLMCSLDNQSPAIRMYGFVNSITICGCPFGMNTTTLPRRKRVRHRNQHDSRCYRIRLRRVLHFNFPVIRMSIHASPFPASSGCLNRAFFAFSSTLFRSRVGAQQRATSSTQTRLTR
jgi:hypothetical protein